MTFGAPNYFWLMLLVPGGIGVTAGWLLWRAGARRRFGGIATEPPLARAALLLTPILLVAAIALAVFAAARPQFGENKQESDQKGIDLVIVLDVSNSMTASDAEPTRLGRSQAEIEALLAGMKGDRVGLIIFAARPFVRSPLTSDLIALSGLVGGVDKERGLLDPGSDLGAAINAGAKLLRGSDTKSKAMLIVSDGEDFGTTVDSAVAAANRDGVRIYTAGVGSTEGAAVIDEDPVTGERIPRIDATTGQPVLTHLDDEGLRDIASTTNARYVELLGAATPLAGLAADFDALAATDFGSKDTANPIERFQVFAALALLLADIELMLLAIPRRTSGRARSLAKLWPVAAPAMFIAALCSTTVADINNDANAEYDRGNYSAALDLYRTAQAKDARTELSYNAGNALNRLAQYDEAIAETIRARCDETATATPTALCGRVEYALGSHYVATSRLINALDAYKRALLIDVKDDDARHNYEVTTRRLTPTPNATSSSREGTPTAGTDEPSSGGQPPDPGASDETPLPGSSGTTPTADGDQQEPDVRTLTREELQRALDEALAGIDREYSPDEAQRILDLLNEENRRSIEDATGDRILPGQPDY